MTGDHRQERISDERRAQLEEKKRELACLRQRRAQRLIDNGQGTTLPSPAVQEMQRILASVGIPTTPANEQTNSVNGPTELPNGGRNSIHINYLTIIGFFALLSLFIWFMFF